MKSTWIFSAAACMAASAVGISAQAAPVSVTLPNCAVYTGFNDNVGIFGADNAGIAKFFGIPFAAPPLGPRRWRDALPETFCPASGHVSASNWPPNSCPQSQETALGPTSEDCLNLNVFTPSTSGPLKPVIVNIHGGGLFLGAGWTNPPDNLAKAGAVVVSPNYRLGFFTAFVDPHLNIDPTDNDDDNDGVPSQTFARGNDAVPSHTFARGNYAISDLIAALKWVKNNIASFGGDPNNVMLYGISSGGTLVQMLSNSTQASGLYQKAWVSGTSWANQGSLAAQQALTTEFINNVCSGSLNPAQAAACQSRNAHALAAALTADQMTNAIPVSALGLVSGSLPVPNEQFTNLLFYDNRLLQGSSTEDAVLVNAVPSVYFSMAEEGDAPLPISSNNITDLQTFAKNNFDLFGSGFGAQVTSVYPISAFAGPDPAEQYFAQMVGDIRTICGSIHGARKAVDSGVPRVYSAVLDRPMDGAVPSFFPNQIFHYTAHATEARFLISSEGPFIDPNFDANDAAFRDFFVARMIEFANTNQLSGWTQASSLNAANYTVNLVHSTGPVPATNFRQLRCDLWRKNGFAAFQWKN